MTTITYRFDPAELQKYTQEITPVLDAANLDSTNSFIARNFAKSILFQWFEDNTADGWCEMCDAWMNFQFGDFDMPLGVEIEFDDPNEAMLFKLTWGGAA